MEETAIRYPFQVLVTFDSPTEWAMNIAAENPDHARALAEEVLKERKNVKIVDIVKWEDIKHPQQDELDTIAEAIRAQAEDLEIVESEANVKKVVN